LGWLSLGVFVVCLGGPCGHTTPPPWVLGVWVFDGVFVRGVLTGGLWGGGFFFFLVGCVSCPLVFGVGGVFFRVFAVGGVGSWGFRCAPTSFILFFTPQEIATFLLDRRTESSLLSFSEDVVEVGGSDKPVRHLWFLFSCSYLLEGPFSISEGFRFSRFTGSGHPLSLRTARYAPLHLFFQVGCSLPPPPFFHQL